MSAGIESKAKGTRGSWLVLSEWEEKADGWHRVAVKSARVDGAKIKADTFYVLKRGKFVKAD